MVLNIPYSVKTPHGIKEAAEICLKCGVCCVIEGYSCPAQYDAQFKPTQTYVYDCLGHEEPSGNKNIWQCVSCHKCEEMCPYEVSPVDFIEAMKEQALQGGHAPQSIIGELMQVITTGYAFPITPNTTRQRERLGLEPVKLNHELGIIAEKTGLLELLNSLKEAQD
ncbi:MAG: hypothetical protein NWE89_12565 [Candidatus Bathyarchaeota archaeon]|nr:hypothetical protein [Candidatus Bathyarchaeota archaeon]